VIADSAIEFEHEVEDTDDVVEKFKEFLDRSRRGLRRRRQLIEVLAAPRLARRRLRVRSVRLGVARSPSPRGARSRVAA